MIHLSPTTGYMIEGARRYV